MRKLSFQTKSLQEKAQLAILQGETRVSLMELDHSADNADPAFDEEDDIVYMEFDDADILDFTNSDGNINPEARSEEGMQKVQRVYESAKDQVSMIAKEEGVSASDFKTKEAGEFVWVYSTAKKKAFLVTTADMQYEEVPWRKAIRDM